MASAQQQKQYRISAPITYLDGKGKEQKTWANVGIAFENDKCISLKVNAIPVNFTGELCLFENEEGDTRDKR